MLAYSKIGVCKITKYCVSSRYKFDYFSVTKSGKAFILPSLSSHAIKVSHRESEEGQFFAPLNNKPLRLHIAVVEGFNGGCR